MFNSLIRRFISWLYSEIEFERVLRIAAAKRETEAVRDAEQRKHATEILNAVILRRSKCRHLKGGGVRGRLKDYALMRHMFLDGSERIQCLICGQPWTPKSLDWQNAVDMMNQSTNTRSSSERSFGPVIDQIEVQTPAQAQAAYAESESNDKKYSGQLSPFVSDGVIKWWDKSLKRLSRKKKV